MNALGRGPGPHRARLCRLSTGSCSATGPSRESSLKICGGVASLASSTREGRLAPARRGFDAGQFAQPLRKVYGRTVRVRHVRPIGRVDERLEATMTHAHYIRVSADPNATNVAPPVTNQNPTRVALERRVAGAGTGSVMRRPMT